MTRAVWLNVSLDVVPFPTFVINGHKDVCSDSQGAVTRAYQHRFLPPHQLQKKSITAGTTGIPTLMFWKLSQKLTGFRTTWTLQVWLSIWKKYPVFVCCFLILSPLAASAIWIMIRMHDCAKHILVFPPTQHPRPHTQRPRLNLFDQDVLWMEWFFSNCFGKAFVKYLVLHLQVTLGSSSVGGQDLRLVSSKYPIFTLYRKRWVSSAEIAVTNTHKGLNVITYVQTQMNTFEWQWKWMKFLTFPMRAGIFMELVAKPMPKAMADSTPRNLATNCSISSWMSKFPEKSQQLFRFL